MHQSTLVVHRMSNGGALDSRISRPPQDADPQIKREAFTPKKPLVVTSDSIAVLLRRINCRFIISIIIITTTKLSKTRI